MANHSPELRLSAAAVLGGVIDGGPSTVKNLTDFLYPDGTTGRGRNAGRPVKKVPKSVQTKVDLLLKQGVLRASSTDAGVVGVAPDRVRAWVLYYGANLIYVGIYDAHCRPIRFVGKPGGEVETALRTSAVLSPIARVTRLPRVLETGVDLLAKLVSDAGPAALPSDANMSHVAVSLGLPAALDHDGQRVVSEDPTGWQDRDGQRRTIDEVIATRWKQRSKVHTGLPELPVGGEPGTLALVAETDVVLDVLGVMRDSRGFSSSRAAPGQRTDDLPRGDASQVGEGVASGGRGDSQGTYVVDPASEHVRWASVVLGVKHSSGIRSTVVTRGSSDLSVKPPRAPGQRRDAVFRGAFGDTLGLGHSIALVHRAKERATDDGYVNDGGEAVTPAFEDVAEWSTSDAARCSCGAQHPPHLQGVASPHAVLRRLGLDRDPKDPSRTWEAIADAIERQDEFGVRAERVLRETGKLMAYAIDTGVRLYDPEVVLVTGSLPFNDVLWNSLRDESDVAGSVRRSLIRATEVSGDRADDPIGPRGGAWIALDTWALPRLVANTTVA